MWGNSPTSTVGAEPRASRTAAKYYSGYGLESIEAVRDHAGVRHHSAIGSAGAPVAIEVGAVMRGAPGRGGDVGEAQPCRLFYQLLPEVDMPGPRPVHRDSTPPHYFRSHFIAVTANANTAVHYNLLREAPGFRSQSLHTDPENPPGGTAPPGVQQRHAATGSHQIHRDAIGDGYGQENPRLGRDPPSMPSTWTQPRSWPHVMTSTP